MTDEIDLGDEEQVKTQKLSARVRQRELDDALVALMQIQGTRKWMWWLLDVCHPFHTPFTADQQITAFNCGEQNIGFRLLAELTRVCPDQYLAMTKENTNG